MKKFYALRNYWLKCVLIGAALVTVAACSNKLAYQDASLPVDQRVEDLLKRLTLDEKIALLGGDSTGFSVAGIKKFDIPPLRMSDGPMGVRKPGSTAFPSAIAMASAWDTALMYDMGVALAKETKAFNLDVILGPCVNIIRMPHGGRNFESYGEDPYLTSRLAVAYVKGVQDQNIIPTVKHYACNNQEWERHNVDVVIDERTLREIYLPHFEATVKEANALGVMAAYNIVNGQHCSENKHLLQHILKEEWGFKGFVVSDWVSVYSTQNAVNNGLDIEMPELLYFSKDSINKYLEAGKITEETIDDKVRRVLRARFLAGMFDEKTEPDTTVIQSKKHKNLALELAEKGIVLLKNENNFLPIKKENIKSIAVIGPTAHPAFTGGGGSSHVEPTYAVSPLEGIKNLAGPDIEVLYALGDTFKDNTIYPIPGSFLFPPIGMDGEGLFGEYFSNRDFEGEPVLTKLDTAINFHWGIDKPGPLLPKDNYSVIWSGRLVPNKTGEHILQIATDDGSMLYVNGELLIDHWGNHGAVVKSNRIYLEAGKDYEIKVKYYEAGGGAAAILGWITPDKLTKTNHLAEAVSIAKRADVVVVCVGDDPEIAAEGLRPRNAFRFGQQTRRAH
ncbi:MAG: hypothetical protein HC896_00620 [Bacteroidales bacterium]|nr:hypothetical protein [Bacteroidales bacterium]